MQNQINSLKGDLKNEIQNTIKSQQAVMMNQQTTFQNNLQNMICGLFQNQASTSGTLPSNTIPNPKGEMKAITTRSGVAYEGPSIPTNPSPKQTLPKTTPILESDIPKSLPKPNIPYPSRRDDQKSHDKASNQIEKIFQIFQDLRSDIIFADALLLIPRFAPTIKSLLMNKEKLLELAKIPLNENCSTMLLKKLLEFVARLITYENSLIYKERTKKLHDSKIKNRIFNVGDRVLLFNSRLKIFSGKLKTRWSGPFTITKVFPYGTIELSQPDGPNFKVNGHRVKHYFGGDLPPKVVQDLHTFSKDE
ncbi:hypothetical protein Tco_0304935 [Tanacetum coccineum]